MVRIDQALNQIPILIERSERDEEIQKKLRILEKKSITVKLMVIASQACAKFFRTPAEIVGLFNDLKTKIVEIKENVDKKDELEVSLMRCLVRKSEYKLNAIKEEVVNEKEKAVEVSLDNFNG